MADIIPALFAVQLIMQKWNNYYNWSTFAKIITK